jgi:hypothetical protein
MSLPKLTAQQSIGPVLGTYVTIISPAINSQEKIETMMISTEGEEEKLCQGEEELDNYMRNDLRQELTAIIELYEQFTSIDAFTKKPSFYGEGEVRYKWLYERTIEGFIYNLLFNRFGITDRNRRGKYLFFLEQPYSSTNTDTFSDIMLFNPVTENIIGIEIKNNYNCDSVISDLDKLADRLEKKEICRGYLIYFMTKSEGSDCNRRVTAWFDNISRSSSLNLFDNIFAILIIHNPISL